MYEGALGGYLLHIVGMLGRLAHIDCAVPDAAWTNTRHHECWDHMDKDLIFLWLMGDC